jgi:ethanolamine utilization protein EutM
LKSNTKNSRYGGKNIGPNEMNGSNQALGIIETRSYAAAIEAADSMVKAARIKISGFVRTGGGFIAVVVRGDVASVKAAVESGLESAEKIGQVIAHHVIPRLDEEVEAVLLSALTDSSRESSE